MDIGKKMIQLLLLVVSVGALYKSWTIWHNPIISLVALILYYGVTTLAWGTVVERVLPLNKNWGRIFGFLVSFYLSAMAVGIPVVVWKYNRLAVAVAMLAVGLVGVTLSRFCHPGGRRPIGSSMDSIASSRDAGLRSRMTFKTWHFILLAILSALFVFLVADARTGAYIFSPWDMLSSFTLTLFFVITFLVGWLVFSNRSAKIILVVLIAFSYLTHLYLPVVYETGFGGDKWRHLGAARWLQEGNIYTPSIWGQEPRSMANFGPLAVPEALVAGNKTSYAAQWSTTIMLAESLGVDVFWVDLLLVFLLWSFFLPLILYQFGKIVLAKERLGLLLAFLPALFYTFQSEGALTLPVSFGHLFFFFVLLLWIYYVKISQRTTLWAASLLSLVFYWGYILNFFVLIGVGVMAIAYRRLFSLPSTPSLARKGERTAIFGLLVVVAMLAIPFLEVWQGLSQYVPGSITLRSLVDALANAFGQMSGWIGTVAPPDFIDQGNFLFNQSGESLSRLPLFSYQLIPFIVSSLVWGGIVWSIYRLLRYYRARREIVFLAILFLISLGSYFVSWSFTAGVHVLSRRLNETIAFFMVLFLGYGIWLWLTPPSPPLARVGIPTRKKILALCFTLAFAATSTYASGPKLQLVTADELKAAELVWSELKSEEPPYCVIANTWPLLGLEAESARQITAGGFPVYHEYAQPERVKIFEMMSKKPSLTWLDGAFRITGANVCYYMNEKRWMSDWVFADTVKLLGEPRRVGTVYIWQVENRRTEIVRL